jgi:hypothetical protein
VLKIWDAHNFRRTLTGLSLIAARLVVEVILKEPMCIRRIGHEKVVCCHIRWLVRHSKRRI